MRVLITGARGFIGRHCVVPLLEHGCEVHGVSSQVAENPEDRGVTWHRADLLNPDATQTLVAKVRPTHLLHNAWITRPSVYWTAPENYAWLAASRVLIHAFLAGGGRRAVVAGTCAVYDWWHNGLCDESTTPLSTSTPYAACKTEMWNFLESEARQAGLGAAIGRIFFAYGPGEPRERLIPSVIQRLLRDEPAECTSGEQSRDFIFVEDVGRALAALLVSDVNGPVNIASGKAASIAEVAQLIGRIIGKEHLIRLGAQASAAQPPLVQARIERLTREVGYTPRVAIEAGLARVIEAMRTDLEGCS